MTALATQPKKQTVGGSVIVKRKPLAEAISAIRRIVPAKSFKEVLTCFRLIVASDAIVLEATNLEQAARITLREVQSEKQFETLVELSKVSAVLNAMQDETLKIQLIDDRLEIRGSDGFAKIGVLPTDQYPPIPEWTSDGVDFVAAAAVFQEVVDQARRAIAKEGTRYAINGLHLVGKDRLLIESTEGHFGCQSSTNLKLAQPINAIAPELPILLTLELAADDSDIECAIDENQIRLRSDDFEVFSNLVEATFPPTDEIVPPPPYPVVADISPEGLKTAIRLAVSVSKGAEEIVLAFSFSRSGITIISRNPNDKSESESVYLCKVDGGDLRIGFQACYILPLLESIKSDTAKILLTSSNRPAVITSSSASGSFRGMIAPINLNA